MIKITKAISFEDNELNECCDCCTNKHDLYNVILGRNENRTNTITLCPTCRKQLSNMLTKRVK